MTLLFPQDTKGIRGYQGDGQFEYTYYPDAMNGNSTTKTGSIEQMVSDLSNMDSKYSQLNQTELQAVIENFSNAYLSKIETKDGAIVSYVLPNENTKPGSSAELGSLYDDVQEGRSALTEAFTKQNEVYQNVYNRVIAYDGAQWHGQTAFHMDNDNDFRLTIVAFVLSISHTGTKRFSLKSRYI